MNQDIINVVKNCQCSFMIPHALTITDIANDLIRIIYCNNVDILLKVII